MRAASWDECVEGGAARRVSPDRAQARSLIATARARLAFVRVRDADDASACFVFEGWYTSALELVQALAVLDGWKVADHVGLGFFLRDILRREDLFRAFDDARHKRHGQVYYGRMMAPEVARDGIRRLEGLTAVLERMAEDRLGAG